MPRYRIHRMKETPRENFRWAAHTGGLAVVRPKDYDSNGEIEAASPYAAWKLLSASGTVLRTGDLLEAITPEGTPGELMIAKYIGFEPATWWAPEPKAASSAALEADGGETPPLAEPPPRSAPANS